jgi:hypothetical protein
MKDGRVIHIAVWDEPEGEGIGAVQCLSCGLGIGLHNGPAPKIVSEIVTFSLGHPCVLTGQSDASAMRN